MTMKKKFFCLFNHEKKKRILCFSLYIFFFLVQALSRVLKAFLVLVLVLGLGCGLGLQVREIFSLLSEATLSSLVHTFV
ncbi:hypothetical protein BD770DRAFT_380629, partial [Pilaira anomala]